MKKRGRRGPRSRMKEDQRVPPFVPSGLFRSVETRQRGFVLLPLTSAPRCRFVRTCPSDVYHLFSANSSTTFFSLSSHLPDISRPISNDQFQTPANPPLFSFPSSSSSSSLPPLLQFLEAVVPVPEEEVWKGKTTILSSLSVLLVRLAATTTELTVGRYALRSSTNVRPHRVPRLALSAARSRERRPRRRRHTSRRA